MTLMAKQHLGLCPSCKGNIGWGHLYVKRNGTNYHTQCDPDKPKSQCWCGGEIGEKDTEHVDCFDRRRAATWFTRAMAGIFSPQPVAKFPRMR